LAAFQAAVGELRDGDSVRLRVADLEGKLEVLSLELDLHYWPTALLRREPAGWQRLEAEPETTSQEVQRPCSAHSTC
ncbi:MAG: hypothetical protein ACREI8_11610, partial [Myxococcota bacterium]